MHHYLKDDFVARIMPLISAGQNCSFRKGCRGQCRGSGALPRVFLPHGRTWEFRVTHVSVSCLWRGVRETEAARGGGNTDSSEEGQHWHSLELCRSQGKALPGWVKRQITHTGWEKEPLLPKRTKSYSEAQPQSTSIHLQCLSPLQPLEGPRK